MCNQVNIALLVTGETNQTKEGNMPEFEYTASNILGLKLL